MRSAFHNTEYDGNFTTCNMTLYEQINRETARSTAPLVVELLNQDIPVYYVRYLYNPPTTSTDEGQWPCLVARCLLF